MTEKMAHKIDVFHQRCLRKLLGVTWKDKVSIDDILQRSNQNCLNTTVKERRVATAEDAGACSPNARRKTSKDISGMDT